VADNILIGGGPGLPGFQKSFHFNARAAGVPGPLQKYHYRKSAGLA